MDKTHLEVSPDLNSTLTYLRVNSQFSQGKRRINKRDASARKISEIVGDRSKSSVATDLKKLKDKGIIVEEGKEYIIKDPKGSYNSLPTEFVRRMMVMFNSDVLNVYNWLYRRYGYSKKIHKMCLFSYGDIVEQALGKFNEDRTRKQAQDILHQLEWNGLIRRGHARVGKTWLWCLLDIRTEFVINDTLNEIEDEIVKGKPEFIGDTKKLLENTNEEDVKIEVVFGFSNENLPKLKATTRGLLMAYKPIEELAEEKGGTVDQMFDWLENGVEGSENNEYIAYERSRLKGKL